MTGKTTYDEALALEVCQRVSQGEHLRQICDDPRIPSERTLRRWMADNDTFRLAFARAREAQMDTYSQEIIDIADDAANPTGERIDKEGNAEAVVDPGAVQAAKLRIDTRWRLMSTLARAIYGDKVDLKVSGSVEVSALSDEELEARTRARLVALGVEVAGPLLLAMPGATKAPTSPPEPEPGEATAQVGESTPSPRSTRKKSANDLLGLVV